MNRSYFLFLIPLFFSIPLALADSNYYRGFDWDETKNFDGSFTKTIGLDPWITTNEGLFVSQITTEDSNIIQIESELVSFVYDKSTCGISIFETGRIGIPIYNSDDEQIGINDKPILTSESWTTKFALNNTNNWITVPWNDEQCTATLIKNSTGDYIETLKQNPQGHTKITYAKPFGKPLETFTEIFNNDNAKNNHKFGSDQSLIKANGVSHEHDIENDRILFTSPEGKQYFLDYSKAKSEYWGLNLNDNELNLDFKGVNEILPPGQTKVLDPTFGHVLTTTHKRIDDNSATAGTGCDNLDFSNNALFTQTVYTRPNTSTTNPNCALTAWNFPLTNIPSTAIITDGDLGFEVDLSDQANPCDFKPMTVDITSASDSAIWTDILDGTAYVSSDASCQSTGTKLIDLGSTFDSDLQSNLGGSITIGISFDDMSRGALATRIDVSAPTIIITYNMPPDIVNNLNATSLRNPPRVDLEWQAGEANGGSSPTYQIERWSGSSWVQLASQSGLTYTDSNPLQQATSKYRILTTDSLGQNLGVFPINQTLSDNLVSRWVLDWTLTDSGLQKNNLTISQGLPSETYLDDTTDPDFPRVGFIFYDDNPGSVPTDLLTDIGQENDYDFEITDPFTVAFWAQTDTTASGSDALIGKMSNCYLSASGWCVRAGSSADFTFVMSNTTVASMGFVAVTGLVIEEWNQIVFTYGGCSNENCMFSYKNGVLFQSGTNKPLAGTTLNTAGLAIGSQWNGNRDFYGDVDDIMIFDTALTPHDVSNLYNEQIDTFYVPNAPTLGSVELSETAIRFTSVAGADSGSDPVKDYGLQCELNGLGGWLNTVANSTLPGDRAYEYTGLSANDSIVCQWRDGSLTGFSNWSNNSTGTAILAIIQTERADTADHLKNFETFLDDQGGLYFGLTLFPFLTMLVGFMAGKKTVRIFTLIILFMMGIFHGSGFFVYPDWYWALAMLFGLGLVLGRQRSD